MIDLSTNYLGMKLRNPLVASASPLSEDIGNIRRMEDAGAAAVVLHSLFEEQIEWDSNVLDESLWQGAESFAEATSYFPDPAEYRIGPEGYLQHIRKAKKAVDIPIIASLNGTTPGGWVSYAKKMEEAGADAIELNIYTIPTDAGLAGSKIEDTYVELTGAVTANVKIPVAVKLSPFFSAMGNMAKRLEKAGARGLVLFNRFYQPDFDLEHLEVVPNLVLSTSEELRLRLRWIAILYGHTNCSMAVTGGVHTTEDILKAMMAGADVVMMTSALLRNGIDHVDALQEDLYRWMDENQYHSVQQMRGSMSQKSIGEPRAFERANYLKVLGSYAGRTRGM